MAAPQEYSPLNAQPYQPVEAPPTPEAKPSPVQDSPGFQFQGHGNISHAGAIAGVFDNVLKGFVNGHAMGEAHKALTLKKKSDDLNASYKADAQRYLQVIDSQLKSTGKVDMNSDDVKSAAAAKAGSWGALRDFRGSLLDQGGKKKSSKGADQQRPPAEILTDPKASAQEKAKAIYDLQGKAGDPVDWQAKALIAKYSSPQGQQAFATQATSTDTAHATGETNNKLATMASQIATLSTKEKLSSEEETQLGDLKKRYTDLNATLHPQKMTATSGHRFSDDGKEQYEVDAQGNEIENTRRPRSSAQAPKPRAAWGKDEKGKYYSVLLDPQTNKEVPESRNFSVQPPASVAGSIKTGQHFWQDANNNIVETPYTTTSRPAGGGTPSAAPSAAASATPPNRQEREHIAGDGRKSPINPYPNPEDQPPDVSLAFNKAWIKPDWKLTTLSSGDEAKFQAWAKSNPKSVEGELDNPKADYDVRGHWLAAQRGDPAATLVMNKWDGKLHGNDKFKTPYNGTFSNESMYATQDAPRWNGDKLVTKDGRLVADETPAATPSKLTRRTKTPPASAAPPSSAPVPTGDASGSKILGAAKLSGPDAKELSDMRTKYHNAVTALQASRDAVAAHLRGQNDSLADKGLAEAWVRSHQGRVTQKTLDQVNGLGGMKLKWDGTKAQIIGGEMSDQQRALFARDANEEYHNTSSNLNDVLRRHGLPVEEPPSTLKSKPKAAKPERPQGVPPAFIYFQASDGNGHWIDPSKLDAAKKIDPKLQVMN